jgi:hypothetical protein
LLAALKGEKRHSAPDLIIADDHTAVIRELFNGVDVADGARWAEILLRVCQQKRRSAECFGLCFARVVQEKKRRKNKAAAK